VTDGEDDVRRGARVGAIVLAQPRDFADNAGMMRRGLA
jgi:hypothetical protein